MKLLFGPMLPGTFAEMNLITPPWPTNPPLFIVASGEDMIAQVNSSKSILMKVRDIKQVPGRKGRKGKVRQIESVGPTRSGFGWNVLDRKMLD